MLFGCLAGSMSMSRCCFRKKLTKYRVGIIIVNIIHKFGTFKIETPFKIENAFLFENWFGASCVFLSCAAPVYQGIIDMRSNNSKIKVS